MNLSRRQFLKYTGAGALALSATPLFDQAALAKYVEGGAGDQVGLLIDTTRCVGCRSCQAACKQKNGLAPDPSPLPANKTFPRQLSATSLTIVEFRQIGATAPNNTVQGSAGGKQAAPLGAQSVIQPVKKQCMHCVNPACASVCPVGAIVKTPLGPVTYDPEKCLGCRYCMAACPFNIPKFEWGSANPRIRKCTLCADLVEKGQPTACSSACPTKAITFGKRADLITEAQARVGGSPDKYTPYIYGLTEVGGTSVLYLASVAFEQLGFNANLPRNDMPDFTWQVMEKIPGVAVGVGLLMGGISFFTHRKKQGQEGGENVGH